MMGKVTSPIGSYADVYAVVRKADGRVINLGLVATNRSWWNRLTRRLMAWLN
jgi:hypothetical protein